MTKASWPFPLLATVPRDLAGQVPSFSLSLAPPPAGDSREGLAASIPTPSIGWIWKDGKVRATHPRNGRHTRTHAHAGVDESFQQQEPVLPPGPVCAGAPGLASCSLSRVEKCTGVPQRLHRPRRGRSPAAAPCPAARPAPGCRRSGRSPRGTAGSGRPPRRAPATCAASPPARGGGDRSTPAPSYPEAPRGRHHPLPTLPGGSAAPPLATLAGLSRSRRSPGPAPVHRPWPRTARPGVQPLGRSRRKSLRRGSGPGAGAAVAPESWP